jgi:aminoglycoside phosphotransferase (APT) family kinase protein
LVQRLESLAPLEECLVPSHGGCRHKQTIGDEHTLAFIDWDGFCLADPALDAATFLARLRLEPVTTGRGMELERLAESLRGAFCGLSPEATRHLPLYEGLVLTEQMMRSFRRTSRDGAMAGTIERLASAAEERLARC